MEGKLSNLYTKWKGQLVKIIISEATIDFVEEDISPEIAGSQIKDIKVVLSELDTHLNDSNKGERLRDGFHIIIAGSPNTGQAFLTIYQTEILQLYPMKREQQEIAWMLILI